MSWPVRPPGRKWLVAGLAALLFLGFALVLLPGLRPSAPSAAPSAPLSASACSHDSDAHSELCQPGATVGASSPDPARDAARAAAAAALATEKQALLRRIAAFDAWLVSFRRQSPAGDAVALARERRTALRRLIALDPAAALGAAVPRGLRETLPSAVRDQLESPVDAFGSLSVQAVCSPDQAGLMREVTVGDRRYQAHTYGTRLSALSKARLPVHGIAVDGQLALAPEAFRRLEEAELASVSPAASGLVVAIGDSRRSFPDSAALEAYAAQAVLAESSIGYQAATRDIASASAPARSLASASSATSTPTPTPTPTTAAAIDTAWINGEKSVLWLLVEFPDDPGASTTAQAIADAMVPVNAYYAAVSRGKTSFRSTVMPELLRISTTKATLSSDSDGYRTISDSALQLARDYDAAHGGTGLYNPDRYDRWIIHFKAINSWGWSGLATVGWIGQWLNGTLNQGVISHELGHNQGLWHSHAWQPSTSSPLQPGAHVEYGDSFDVMGYSGSFPSGHFNARQKSLLGYLSAAEVSQVGVTGQYRLYRHDHAQSAGVQALQVAAGTAYDYWIESRRDSSALTWQGADVKARLTSGIVIHWGKQPSFTLGDGSYLLDMTPLSSFSMYDAPLARNETFVDSEQGIAITPIGEGGVSPNEYVDVVVSLGATGTNHNPTLSIGLPEGVLQARTDLTFTAVGTDEDGDTLHYRWDFGDGQPPLYASTATRRWLKGGTYTVSCSAIDGRGGVATKSVDLVVEDPLSTWVRRSPSLTANQLSSVTYGNGRFIATEAASGYVLSSGDGVTWRRVQILSPVSQSANGSAFGAGRHVVVGHVLEAGVQRAMVLASSDGLSWSTVYLSPSAGRLTAVTWSGTRFVAVGEGGELVSSSDGVTWVRATSPTDKRLNAVAHAAGRFIAVGAEGVILSSTDGVTWVLRTGLGSATLVGVAQAAGKWWAASASSLQSSSDGETWQSTAVSFTTSVQGLRTLSNGILIAPSNIGRLLFSEDGLQWATYDLSGVGNTSTFLSLAEGNGTLVLVGSGGVILQNGLPRFLQPEWPDLSVLQSGLKPGQAVSLPVSASGFARVQLYVDGQFHSEILGNGPALAWTPSGRGGHDLEFRGVASDGSVVSSLAQHVVVGLDMADWRRRDDGSSLLTLNSLCFSGGQFVAVGDNNVALSGDGSVWVYLKVDPVRYPTLRSVVAFKGRYIAAGSQLDSTLGSFVPVFYSSANGFEWTRDQLGTGAGAIIAMAASAQRLVAVGEKGQAFWSDDGRTWTQGQSPATQNFTQVAQAGGQFLATTSETSLYRSADGLTWEKFAVPGTQNLQGVAYLGGQWNVSSYYSVWRSSDLLAWTRGLDAVNSSGMPLLSTASGSLLFRLGMYGQLGVCRSGGAWDLLKLGTATNRVAALGEGRDTLVALLDFGGVFQHGEPLNLAPQFRDRSLLANGPSPATAQSLAVIARGFSKVQLLVDGVSALESTQEDPVFTWTAARFGARWLQLRGIMPDGSVFLGVPVRQVPRLDQWSLVSPEWTLSRLNSVLRWRNRWIAVGQQGVLLSSADGAAFSTQAFPSAVNLRSVATDGVRLVVGSEVHSNGSAVSGTILWWSDDGVTWTKGALGSAPGAVSKVYHASGYWVALCESGQVLRSVDGASWTVAATLGQGLADVAWSEGRWVVVGGGGQVRSSTDLTAWTLETSPSSANITGICKGATRWLLVTSTGESWVSADGRSWTLAGSAPSEYFTCVTVHGGLFVAAGIGGVLHSSADGAVWTRHAARSRTAARSLCSSDGLLLGVGDHGVVFAGATAELFQPLPGTPRVSLPSLASDGRRLVVANTTYDSRAVASLPSLHQVSFGGVWTPATGAAVSSSGAQALAQAAGTWVSVGNFGEILRSTDALSWTKVASGTSQSLHDVVFAEGRWLAVGVAGTIQSSADGLTWTARSSGAREELWSVCAGGGRYVAVGGAGVVLSSVDGANWTRCDSPGTQTLVGVAWLEGTGFLAVGSAGQCVRSADGLAWTAAFTPAPVYFNDVAAVPGGFVAVDYDTVYTSADGETWTATRTPDAAYRTLHYDGATLWAGGQWGTLWRHPFSYRETAPVITSANAAGFVVGSAGAFTVSASGTPAPGYSATGLPSWATLNTVTGVLSGTAPLSAIGTHLFTVSADNGVSPRATQAFTLQVTHSIVLGTQPLSLSLPEGGAGSFSVQATGTHLSYQWQRYAVSQGLWIDVVGGTGATLSFSALGISQNGGQYRVVVSDGADQVVSSPVTLTVLYSRLVNLSVRSLARSQLNPLIMGFVVKNGMKPLLMRSWGPALVPFGVTGTLKDPVMELHDDINNGGAVIASNDNWGTNDVATLRTVFTATGAFNFSDAGSKDAALLQSPGGLRTLYAFDRGSEPGVTLLELYDADETSSARLVNVSARNYVGTGDDILVAGFSLHGNAPKRLLIRGVGPTLAAAPFNLPGMIADPLIKVFRIVGNVSTQIDGNDDWAGGGVAALRAAFVSTEAFNLPDDSSKDAALLITLDPGLYSIELHSKTGVPGEAMIEVFEVP